MSRTLRSTANTSTFEELPVKRRKRTCSRTTGHNDTIDNSESDGEQSQYDESNGQPLQNTSINVSEVPVLQIEQNNDDRDNNENESNLPTQDLVVENTDLDIENENQRLRRELEAIQKENQEIARQKQRKIKEREQLDLRRKINEATRLRSNLRAAVNSVQVMQTSDINNSNGNSDGIELSGVSDPPPVGSGRENQFIQDIVGNHNGQHNCSVNGNTVQTNSTELSGIDK